MKNIAKTCFPKAIQVTDRFHVQKLALEALQDIRIKHRWNAIDSENKGIKIAKEKSKEYLPEVFDNGDTRKQLLARSRYLLYKSPEKWTQNQYLRSKILFEQYPDIKKAFNLNQSLRNIYNTKSSIKVAYTKLNQSNEICIVTKAKVNGISHYILSLYLQMISTIGLLKLRKLIFYF